MEALTGVVDCCMGKLDTIPRTGIGGSIEILVLLDTVRDCICFDIDNICRLYEYKSPYRVERAFQGLKKQIGIRCMSLVRSGSIFHWASSLNGGSANRRAFLRGALERSRTSAFPTIPVAKLA